MRKKKKKRGDYLTNHHIPPRSRGVTRKILAIPAYKHRAYHLLFANAGSIEECLLILKKEWWV